MGFSLLVGVVLASLVTLIWSILLIAVCSSAEPIQLAGIIIPPGVQVAAASWAFVGIPCSVVGGVGAVHRIEAAVRGFFLYSCVGFVLSLTGPLWFVFTGSLCDMLVHPDLQSQGTAFVCGFADTIVFVWGVVLTAAQAYMLYIIWSAAEEIAKNPFPELNRFYDALRKADLPQIDAADVPPEQRVAAAFGMSQEASFAPSQPQEATLSRRPQRTPVSEMLSAAEAAGQAYQFGPAQGTASGRGGFDEGCGASQSFVPSPPEGFRFASGGGPGSAAAASRSRPPAVTLPPAP